MKTTLVSIAAKNVHKMLAAWCLKTYCAESGITDVAVVEVNINNSVFEIVEAIAATKPDAIGFSCYIWNIDCICKIGGLLKTLYPSVKIILGGPEVSFEQDCTNYPFADFMIKGQGERAFCSLLKRIAAGDSDIPRVIAGSCDDFSAFPSPFCAEYFASFSDEQIPEIASRLIYYESARGCPFSCAYCLSSTADGVQALSVDRVKRELSLLLKHGAACIKFVDRTFNADKKRAAEILEWVGSQDTGCVFHFEAAADLFDDRLLSVIRSLPPGRVQFEIGIQSVNPETIAAVSRKTDTELALKNIRTLTSFQNCHVHVDLIAGLPFETLESFANAINCCILANPHALQLGFLKRLNGTRIAQTYSGNGAVFADFAPYEVYRTDTLSFDDLAKLRQISGVINRYYNSGLFASSVAYAIEQLFHSPFQFFEAFTCYLSVKQKLSALSLKNAYTVLLEFLTQNGDRMQAEHHIKLDCLSVDAKGQLPDAVASSRNRQLEQEHLKKNGACANLRIEFFPFDRTHRLFLYDKKNPITNRYGVTVFESV